MEEALALGNLEMEGKEQTERKEYYESLLRIMTPIGKFLFLFFIFFFSFFFFFLKRKNDEWRYFFQNAFGRMRIIWWSWIHGRHRVLYHFLRCSRQQDMGRNKQHHVIGRSKMPHKRASISWSLHFTDREKHWSKQ